MYTMISRPILNLNCVFDYLWSQLTFGPLENGTFVVLSNGIPLAFFSRFCGSILYVCNTVTLAPSSASKKVAGWSILCPAWGCLLQLPSVATPTMRVTPSSWVPNTIVDITWFTFFPKKNTNTRSNKRLICSRLVARSIRKKGSELALNIYHHDHLHLLTQNLHELYYSISGVPKLLVLLRCFFLWLHVRFMTAIYLGMASELDNHNNKGFTILACNSVDVAPSGMWYTYPWIHVFHTCSSYQLKEVIIGCFFVCFLSSRLLRPLCSLSTLSTLYLLFPVSPLFQLHEPIWS